MYGFLRGPSCKAPCRFWPTTGSVVPSLSDMVNIEMGMSTNSPFEALYKSWAVFSAADKTHNMNFDTNRIQVWHRHGCQQALSHVLVASHPESWHTDVFTFQC
jgi:hypothetical protein